MAEVIVGESKIDLSSAGIYTAEHTRETSVISSVGLPIRRSEKLVSRERLLELTGEADCFPQKHMEAALALPLSVLFVLHAYGVK